MKLVIGILGEKLAGKDTVAEYLTDKYGLAHIKTSRILDDLLNVLGLPITRQNEIDAGKGMEHIFGPRVIGEAVKKRVLGVPTGRATINGLRFPDQFEDAKDLGAKIIYVTAPVELRHQRSLKRVAENKDGQVGLEEFKAQDQSWSEKNISSLGAKADFKIDNTGTLEDLYGKIDKIIKKISNFN